MANARHSKAGRFVQQRLFCDLSDFAELERRIAALPDEQSRGAAFEVFAEAYLATQRKYDAAQVWPHDSVPLDILKNLGLSQQDRGVDGVLQTLLGQFDAYQVKFRTGRPSLTWRELSTFFGLTDSARIHSRVVFTNCDEFPDDLKDRRGFFCIRGSDLDRLEADDFRAIEAWLADAVFIAPKKSPDKDHIHQAEALNALVSALQTQPRVSAIMACGTGKTLVALWVAERLETKRVLVLLPSLALLRQTLHEWVRETNLPPWPWLCVCSDLTVKEGIDPLVTQQSDLDFQVTTDPASVRSFLDAPFAGVKIIFSTYQSASVVGAAMQPGEAFDFAVFDEAHKTAGREGRNFAFALDDKNLSIRKRLFLTATPRHYNPLAKNKDGGAQLVFSMDKPSVYGPVVYRLPFSEAAKRGIISDYKVIISEVTSDMVNDELLRRGIVLVKGEEIKARQVANQIALKSANQGRLDAERCRRLEDLGFDFDPNNSHWEKYFRQLVEFKQEHGHTNVPQRSGKYAALGTWVRNQRAAKRYKRPIMAERAKRLDEIGFVWMLIEPMSWEKMFAALVEFKKVHGHCNVPQKAGEHRRLGKWVNSQRTAYYRGKIKPARKQQLDLLGFVWNLRPNLPAAR